VRNWETPNSELRFPNPAQRFQNPALRVPNSELPIPNSALPGPGKGGLQTVLNEQMLRVTLVVEVVKLTSK
jgi:hypothetical protein